VPNWSFFIDRGGTFTDCFALSPNGEHRVVKVLSTDDAPLRAIRKAMQLTPDAPIPTCDVRLGTTLATNAVLERKGARTALLITEGFADLLEIGTQARPDIFSLHIHKQPPLCERVLETSSRASPDGTCVAADLNAELELELRALKESGIESLAIAVLNGHRAPHLELELEARARRAGFEHISLSHRAVNELGLLTRTETTVIDAYLAPVLGRYFEHLRRDLPEGRLLVMQSSGNLAEAKALRGAQSLLSGPAGGVVACEHLVSTLKLGSAIGFDMGGTSTDVCRVEPGAIPRVYDAHIAGLRVVAPLVDVHTVAAGGGSICQYDLGRLHVGPESAGAHPGPACYGSSHATALTVTDVNLLLGRLQTDTFPIPIDPLSADREARKLHAGLSETLSLEEMLVGLLEIANFNMAEAVREVSLRRGFDLRKDALIAFGGAAGQHACALARELGMRRVVFPRYAGILSACGMACASHVSHHQLDGAGLLLQVTALPQIETRFTEVLSDSTGRTMSNTARSLALRYKGREARIVLPWTPNIEALSAEFHAQHLRLFGFAREGHAIEVAALHVELQLEGHVISPFADTSARPASLNHMPPLPLRQASIRLAASESKSTVPVYRRSDLAEGTRLLGPCCVVDETGCLIIEPAFEAVVSQGHLVCTDVSLEPQTSRAKINANDNVTPRDPVTLELMGQAFMGIAKQMGVMLQRTALSTNIQERLDFSCAVFDRDANLVANAPHIPVHLGAMGETVRHVARVHEPRPGDVFASNDPNHGGSHLPDITVVTPVFDSTGVLCYWVANRGHHSDVGGITPGSMPAFSRTLAEEGVLLSAVPITEQGRFQRDKLLQLLQNSRYPARSPETNLADLEAQVAANHLGARLLLELERRMGRQVVPRYMAHLQDYAAELTRSMIAKLPKAPRTFVDYLDDGSRLAVTLTPDGDGLNIDFEAPVPSQYNHNAPRAVTVAAVLYVLRCLLGTRLPLNAGCLRPVQINVPFPSLLSPSEDRAVCSGNVETSQRIVDVLLGCFGAASASQGTMNNVTFGNDTFGYYETVAGGAGAGPGFNGASAVQTHMTNTRITDAEVVESRFPVRIRRFSVRRGSGGPGAHSGGDGCVREYEFLAALSLTVVSERRTRRPFGLEGGDAGALGKNLLNGRELPGRFECTVAPGDILRLETPGGGGFGAK
jgi:5-oxoprolinase (ATP-hydrolysing)